MIFGHFVIGFARFMLNQILSRVYGKADENSLLILLVTCAFFTMCTTHVLYRPCKNVKHDWGETSVRSS